MKKKLLSLALALALCLSLSIPAAAVDEETQTITIDTVEITNVLYYGSELDSIVEGLHGVPVICRAPAEVTALVLHDYFFGATEQDYYEYEGGGSLITIHNIKPVQFYDMTAYEKGAKMILDQPGTYIIDMTVPSYDPETGNGGSAPYEYRITVLGKDDPAPSSDPFNQFADVAPSSPYADGVKWAVKSGITNGKTPTSFGPNDVCTVSHILTFLWRAYDLPDESGAERQAVLSWAKGKGLIKDGQNLDAPCTRAMAVTFMWKASDCPEPYETSSFSDVPANAAYKQAVDWAVGAGITSGTGDGSAFSPNSTCTRGQIVTFLFRDFFDGGF